MSLKTINVPYDDVMELKADSAKLSTINGLLQAKFPDAECQLVAIKSVIGVTEEEEKPEEPNEEPGDTTDDTAGTDDSQP